MGDDFQLIEIVFLAAIAVFVLLRLRQILGRRTGSERRRDPFSAREQLTTPVRAKDKSGQSTPLVPDRVQPTEEKRARIGSIAPEGSALNQALNDIQGSDRQFDVDRFVSGARSAYQIIVTAYAKGDKAALRPLLSDEVFTHFSAAIDGHARRNETVQFELVSIKDARITAARLEARQAEITLTFETEIITTTKNSDGAIIAGDPSTVVNVIDIWSFARDVKAKTPDWLLTATDTSD